MARPKTELKPKHYPMIEGWASDGASKKQIARNLRMSFDTFNRILKEDQRAADAYDAGRDVEHDALRGALFSAAMDGNVAAAMFLLKCRFNYREQAPVQTESRLTVEMKLPAPLRPGDYARVIEQEPAK